MSGIKRFKTQMEEYGELEFNMWLKYIAFKAAYEFYEIYLNWLIKRRLNKYRYLDWMNGFLKA